MQNDLVNKKINYESCVLKKEELGGGHSLCEKKKKTCKN